MSENLAEKHSHFLYCMYALAWLVLQWLILPTYHFHLTLNWFTGCKWFLVTELWKLCGTAWWELFQIKRYAPKANFALNKEIT